MINASKVKYKQTNKLMFHRNITEADIIPIMLRTSKYAKIKDIKSIIGIGVYDSNMLVVLWDIKYVLFVEALNCVWIMILAYQHLKPILLRAFNDSDKHQIKKSISQTFQTSFTRTLAVHL